MFQRRLCWMLSSILQQKGDVPRLIFNVAYPANEGNPTTESVCSFFRKEGLNVVEVVFSSRNEFQQRGLIRNKQLEKVNADWVLFADADMVYDPLFFEDIGEKVMTVLKDEEKCISSRRTRLPVDHCCLQFNEKDSREYPCVVNDVASLVNGWPREKKPLSKNCGAGYFQLIHVEKLRARFGNTYIDPKNARDQTLVHLTPSDERFRRMLGGVVGIDAKPQYHLNHERCQEVARQW